MHVHAMDLGLHARVRELVMPHLRAAEVVDLPYDPPIRSLRTPTLRTVVKSFRFPDPAVPDQPWKPRAEVATPTLTPGVITPCANATIANAMVGGESTPAKSTVARQLPDTLSLKDRLFYRLLPPIDAWLGGGSVQLPAQPFPYQCQGIGFLVPRTAALLGDEMGLGKTMQSIVAIRLLLASGGIRRALIVCPKPLVANWCRELKFWAGDLLVQVVEGSTRKRQMIWELPQVPVKVVNYELLVRDSDFVAEAQLEFDLCVLDEAQRIKNEDSQTARAARRLKRHRSWAMSGTPIENHADDLISIFRFIDPTQVPDEPTPDELRRSTAPFIIRRRKEEVLDQLPPKVMRDALLDLSPAQRETYETAERDGVLRLNEMGGGISVQNVFELILRLKQICNFDPATGESAKLDQLRNDLEEVAESGRKAIVFSQWVNTLERIASAIPEYHPLEFHGSVPSKQRQAVLHQFRENPDAHVLLISYGAGAVGLNLQFAQYLFLFDRWWNPAVEDQAINRVHRIGQKETVFITRFLATCTIEERINEVLEQKRALSAEILPSSHAVASSAGLKEEDIFKLFDIRVRPNRPA